VLKAEIAAEFRSLVGEDWFLTAPEDLATYSYDAFIKEFQPDAVILPADRAEISKMMRVASREKINIIPRGAGTNLCGNTVARQGGIVLDLNRLNKIIEIDTANLCAVVQPGVINADLQKAAAQFGLMFGPDPASMMACTIGGNVALNAGGPRALKYGVTRDNLLGLEVVLTSGDIIRTGGKTIKNVTGYDLTRLLCGSEGTLGIITEIIAKLVAVPPQRKTFLASFASLYDVARSVSSIIGSAIIPAALELMEKVLIDLVKNYAGLIFPEDAEAVLLIEIDGDEDSIQSMSHRITEICFEENALRVDSASTPKEAERLWQARRAVGPAARMARPLVFSEDATVPVSKLPDIIQKIAELRQKHRLMVGVLAHAGDGNLHPIFMADMNDTDEMERLEQFIQEMYEATIAMGGTLSGEHGIGIAKAKYMPLEYNAAAIEIMRGIKKVFDPHNILNPGSFL